MTDKLEEKKEKKRKIIRSIIVILMLVALFLAAYLPLKLTGTLEKIDSPEELRDIILSGGMWSYVIYFALQFLQVVILPIPAFVSTVAGTLVFGPWIATGISLVSIMIASLFSFWLGKKIGRRAVVWIAGKDDAEKWDKKLSRGKYMFFLMMLFPVFPDDLLCLLAGATTMSYKFFIITILLTRPIGIIATCFIGSGELIPYSGWGIPVWSAIIAFAIIIFYLSIKYQQQIETYFLKLSHKMKKSFTKKSKKVKD